MAVAWKLFCKDGDINRCSAAQHYNDMQGAVSSHHGFAENVDINDKKYMTDYRTSGFPEHLR